MKSEERELRALLQLIDDPDQEVYDTVADKILHYGAGIIPNLEGMWEETPDEAVQERLELLIHRVHFQNLQADFELWSQAEQPDLLTGAMLVARYRFPGLSGDTILHEIKKIERNIWLELNNYLTSLEKINVLNSMIYSYFGVKGVTIANGDSNQFFINKVVETRSGNAIAIGILYQTICHRLDIPVYAVGLPRQFLLGYFDLFNALQSSNHKCSDAEELKSVISFYIDPMQGQIYTEADVKVYLKKLNITERPNFFKPQSTKNIIRLLLTELSLCYENKKDHYRYEELRILIAIIEK